MAGSGLGGLHLHWKNEYVSRVTADGKDLRGVGLSLLIAVLRRWRRCRGLSWFRGRDWTPREIPFVCGLGRGIFSGSVLYHVTELLLLATSLLHLVGTLNRYRVDYRCLGILSWYLHMQVYIIENKWVSIKTPKATEHPRNRKQPKAEHLTSLPTRLGVLATQFLPGGKLIHCPLRVLLNFSSLFPSSSPQ